MASPLRLLRAAALVGEVQCRNSPGWASAPRGPGSAASPVRRPAGSAPAGAGDVSCWCVAAAQWSHPFTWVQAHSCSSCCAAAQPPPQHQMRRAGRPAGQPGMPCCFGAPPGPARQHRPAPVTGATCAPSCCASPCHPPALRCMRGGPQQRHRWGQVRPHLARKLCGAACQPRNLPSPALRAVKSGLPEKRGGD